MFIKNKNIYLDYAATTPVSPDVFKAVNNCYENIFGNPSSQHAHGQEALALADEARERVQKFFNCASDQVVFTSGATEANNLCLRGVFKRAQKNGIAKPHFITSAIEHPSVLEVFYELEEEGALVDVISVDQVGQVNPDDIKARINNNTVLVSLMYVNNEIVVIQPIREVGKIVKKVNDNRLKHWKQLKVNERARKPNRIFFHSDATQAVQFLNCDIEWNYIDMLTCSAHKIYGPKGVGVLIAKNDAFILPLIVGGGQERGLRAGTLNVPAIVGLGKSLELLSEKEKKKVAERIRVYREVLINEIKKLVKGVKINNEFSCSVPSFLNLAIKGIDAESLAIALDMAGVSISVGSACTSHKVKESSVLKSIGLKKDEISSSFRVSLGKHTKKNELMKFAVILNEVVLKIRG